MTVMVSRDIELLETLRDVEDPEFPVSVVDLGLIVGLQERGGHVDVQITFTSMGCPGMDFILDDVRDRLLSEPGVSDVSIEIVWHPIWSKERLSDDAKLQLRAWGISL